MERGSSLWLGPLRGPVRILMIAFVAATLLIWAWLVVNRLLSGDASPGMHEMIRPAGLPIVQAMLIALFGAILFGSIYLSDTRGAIEGEPHGFFDILSLVTSRMAMIMVALIVLIMFYEVVSRYVFLKPTLWANELSLWIAAFVGALLALKVMGFEGVAAGMLAGGGATAIVFGFAFRQIGENLLAGLFLVFSRPFRIGDLIQSGGLPEGTVEALDLRNTHIRTTDGRDIFIPNPA